MYKSSEVVWAADGGKIYEAKILKTDETAGIRKYFVHFQGWARKYDNWIDEHLLAPLGNEKKIEALRLLSKELLRNPNAKNSTKKEPEVVPASPALPASPAPVNATRSSKKGRQGDDEDTVFIKEAMRKRKELHHQELVDEDDEKYSSKLQMPYTLKKHLVDEWSVITREPKRLLKLPRVHSVSSILKEFLANKKRSLRGNEQAYQEYEELYQGLREQFNHAIVSVLLYRQERVQYNELCKLHPAAKNECSDYYGAEHLVRFYCKFSPYSILIMLSHLVLIYSSYPSIMQCRVLTSGRG